MPVFMSLGCYSESAIKGLLAKPEDRTAAVTKLVEKAEVLFQRLAQAVFRPGGKVRHPCQQCGLQRHEMDAVHCKACDLLLSIPNDGD